MNVLNLANAQEQSAQHPGSNMVLISHTEDTDILFGRCSDAWNHVGNRRFRVMVAKYHEQYHSTKSRTTKAAIVSEIISKLKSCGTRLLKRDKDSSKWFVVEDHKCWISKVCQILFVEQPVVAFFCISQESFSPATITQVGHAIRDRQTILRRKEQIRLDKEEIAAQQRKVMQKADFGSLPERMARTSHQAQTRGPRVVEQFSVHRDFSTLNEQTKQFLRLQSATAAAAHLAHQRSLLLPCSTSQQLLFHRKLDVLLAAENASKAREERESIILNATAQELALQQMLGERRKQAIADELAVSQRRRRFMIGTALATGVQKQATNPVIVPSKSSMAAVMSSAQIPLTILCDAELDGRRKKEDVNGLL